MTKRFATRLHACWNDMDSNAHMGNAAFLNAATDVRMKFFASLGLPPAELAVRVRPAVLRDEIDYYGTFRLLETIHASIVLGGLSPDAARFRLINEFHRDDGQLAVRITSSGGWLDLVTRTLTAPPLLVGKAMRTLKRSSDFVELSSL